MGAPGVDMMSAICARLPRVSGLDGAFENSSWLDVTVFLLVFLLGLIGLVFCSLGIWAYLLPGIENLHRDKFVFALASIGRTEWHRTFVVADHPVLYALRVLIDFSGALGPIGVGLAAFGALISTATKSHGPITTRMENLAVPWIMTSMILFGAHFALMVIPYLMSFGIVDVQ